MYEMLVGYPPFYSDDPVTTCRKVSFLNTLALFFLMSMKLLDFFYLFCDFGLFLNFFVPYLSKFS